MVVKGTCLIVVVGAIEVVVGVTTTVLLDSRRITNVISDKLIDRFYWNNYKISGWSQTNLSF